MAKIKDKWAGKSSIVPYGSSKEKNERGNYTIASLDGVPLQSYRKLGIGEALAPDDIVVTSNIWCTTACRVTRVTKTLAITKINNIAEHKYPITYSYGFQNLPKERFNTTNAVVYRLKTTNE